MWCVIELNMSIVGGCIATFKPFLRKYFPRVLGSSHNPAMLYGSNTGASRSRRRGQSYQLESMGQSESFNHVASNKKGFAFGETFRMVFKNFIGLGVCVNETSPAL